MRLSMILSGYLARQYILRLSCCFAVLLLVGLLFDVVELLRRASGKADIGAQLVIKMSLLKLPHLFQDILPFAVLLGGMVTFWFMARANELVIARAAGVSVWQLLAPPVLITLILGGVLVTVFNPFATLLREQYEKLEAKHLNHHRNLLAVSGNSIWMRQGTPERQQVIRAGEVAALGARLRDVTVFEMAGQDRFAGRIDAREAVLMEGHWALQDAYISRPGEGAVFRERHQLPTDLDLKKIHNSFTSVDTLSFWELPGFIRTMEAAGFNANAHRLYFNSLLATPLLLASMVLFAAVFCLRAGPRRVRTGVMIAGGVGSGFLLYFLTNVVHALGLSMSIPAVLAAWMPAAVSAMLGITALLHLEDG